MGVVLAPLAYGGSITQWAYLAQAKSIILERHDHYQKQTFRNRLYIHGANGKLMLTIPIKHLRKEGYQDYKDVRIDNAFPWQTQHWKSLQTAYRSSPYFEFYEDAISPLYKEEFEGLYTFNKTLFEVIKGLLGINTTPTFTSEYSQNPKQLDVRELLNVKKQEYSITIKYTQVFGDKNGFIPNLSVLDLLFNLGPESLSALTKSELVKKL